MNQEDKNNEETNLNGTFKDFSENVKSQDKQQQSIQTFYPDAPKIIKWVVKYSGGLIKDEEEATYALLWFVVVSVIISLFLIFSRNGTGQNIKPYHPNTQYGGREIPDNMR